VNPSNFLAVLKGDSNAMNGLGSGKVLKSDANSKVFISFFDHGAPGLIAFPNGELYADDLIDTINYMHTNEMYDQLVFYLEACESGSMFSGLLADDINVYATTAANEKESSWGTYCSPDDVVNGVHIGSCLGDLYSVNWMEDSDAMDPSIETLSVQFETVKELTAQSHVMEYGQTDFKNEVVGDFIGDLDITPADKLFMTMMNKARKPSANPTKHTFAVSSRDAKLNQLYGNVLYKNSQEANLELMEELTHRMKVDHIFETIVGKNLMASTTEFQQPRNFECLKTLVSHFKENCGAFSDYSLKHVKYLVNECETLSVPSAVDGIMHRISRACNQ
jgi:legumain